MVRALVVYWTDSDIVINKLKLPKWGTFWRYQKGKFSFTRLERRHFDYTKKMNPPRPNNFLLCKVAVSTLNKLGLSNQLPVMHQYNKENKKNYVTWTFTM